MNHSRQRQSRQKQASNHPPADSAMEQAGQHYNEGVTLQEQDKITLAESAFRRALSLHPDFAEAHNNLGNVLLEQNKWKPAEKSFRHALEIIPDNAMLLRNLGKALHHQGNIEAALVELRKALNLDPWSAATCHLLGNVLMEFDKVEEACEHYNRAHELLPKSPEIATRLGTALNALGRYEEAVTLLHTTIKTHPRYFDAYPALAEAACEIGAVDDAIKILKEAIILEPGNAGVHAKLAQIHHARQEYLAARNVIAHAIKLDPKKPEYYDRMGLLLRKLHLLDNAEAMHRKAIALDPGNAGSHNKLGLTLKSGGKTDEATVEFRKAIRLNPDYIYAYTNLEYLTQHHQHDDDITRLEQFLQDENLPDEDQSIIHSCLCKAFDDRGNYDKAFAHMSAGNALNKKMLAGNNELETELENISRIRESLTGSFLQQNRDTGYAGYAPIFITGLPRSGKTVLETILDRHKLVTAGGESRDFGKTVNEILVEQSRDAFPDGIRSMDKPIFEMIGKQFEHLTKQRFEQPSRVTNTSPANTLMVGMIHLCLPDAKIILCQREARDLCTAIYMKNFMTGYSYSYDQVELGNYYNCHKDLMAQWQQLLPDFVLVVQFEDLIRDPQTQINTVLDFCNLPREEACLDTASLPTHDAVIGIWKHYREQLKPMCEILA